MEKARVTYTVVFDSNLHKFLDKINQLKSEGWKPLGGVNATINGFYQAMVRG